MSWLDAFLTDPPGTLAALEPHVGPLEIDDEIDVVDDEDDFNDRFGVKRTNRGELRPGIERIVATFDLAPFTGPRRDRPLASVQIVFATSPLAVVERRFGRGRAFPESPNEREYGRWFYLSGTRLTFQRERHLSPIRYLEPQVRADFLETLIDRLACDTSASAVLNGIDALVDAAAADLGSIDPDGVETELVIGFRPALLLPLFVSTMRWQRPIAFAHGDAWIVAPFETDATPYRLGDWSIAPHLVGPPRTRSGELLSEVDGVVELVGCDTDIASLAINRVA